MLALGLALARQPAVILVDELSMGLARSSSTASSPSCAPPPTTAPASCSSSSTSTRPWTIADRVYVMDRGRISITGDAEELRSRIDEIQTSYLAGPERPERNGHSARTSVLERHGVP